MKKTQYFVCFYLTILFKSAKTIRLNSTRYFIMEIPNKREFQQIASIHLQGIDFMKLYRDYTKEPYSCLVLEFLTDKGLLPEKDFLEKASTIKRFEYSLLGKELK